MKILDFLKRDKGVKKPPLPPIRTIRRPGEARAKNQARLAKEFEESGAFEAEKNDENKFMDTGSLELQRDSSELDNPYETHSWEMDRDEGLRRIDDQSLVNRKKAQVSPDNPYDTSAPKKGW